MPSKQECYTDYEDGRKNTPPCVYTKDQIIYFLKRNLSENVSLDYLLKLIKDKL